MTKLLFNIIAYVVGIIIWVLGTMFVVYGELSFSEWGVTTRFIWLLLGLIVSALFPITGSLFMWNWYYNLKDN